MHPLAGVLFQFEKLANAPNTFISAVIRPIIFKKFEKKDFVGKSLPIVAGLSWLIFSLLVPFTILLFQHHQLVVRTIFGVQWESYSLYFFIIWVGYSFFSAFNCYDRIYDILNKQKQKFLLECSLTTISIFAYWWISQTAHNEYFILIYTGIIMTTSILTVVIVYGLICKKLFFAISLFFGMILTVCAFLIIGFCIAQIVENLFFQSLLFLLICYCLTGFISSKLQVAKWLLKIF
jgi:O-antigen/teichoic acid export membrane protein